MKKILLGVMLVLGLCIPASANAHIDYYNVHITGSPWSNTFVQGQPITYLNCWQTAFLSFNETKYIRHAQTVLLYYDQYGRPVYGGGPGHFGLTEVLSWNPAHYHPLWNSDFVTGPETRQFAGVSTTIGTRRVHIQEANGLYTAAVKFVHQSGSYGVYVRANC